MGDADTANIQKLIKKVIEATRCSPSQAELALYDNDNNIFAAVEYILDKGIEIESWTEQKSRKDKKKEEEERSKATRGHASSRGRGGGADRGGRGRGVSASTSRGGGPSRGGGTSRGGRGQSNASRPQQGRSQPDSGVLKSVDLNEDSSEWKGGSMEFKRSEPAAAPPAVPSGSSTTPSAPASTISFAAVAAAAARREQQKNQPPPAAPAPVEPPRAPTPEPTPVDSVSSDEGNFHEPASSHAEENIPVHQDEPVNVSSVHNVQAASPQLQANVTWTSQLKNDLGIGVAPISADVSPVKPPQSQQQFPATSTLPGVEFATDSAAAALTDYHFGFVDAPQMPPAPVEPVPPPTSTLPTAAEALFANARHSAAAVAPLKTEMHLGNGEYRATSPPVSSALTQPRLGFGETSTVSYSPVPTGGVDTRSQNIPKPLSHMAAAQQPQQSHQQQQQQHQPQQQPMFPSQMPFSAYGNPYMYSPVTTGIRPEDYTAALLQSYPFGMPGMDMANLMGGGAFPQSSSSQSLTNQHRSDNHAIDNTIKFSTQTNRQENQQPAAVQPPPGFGSPFGMQPPQMNMLQQHYNPQQYPAAHFMMPNIGTAGGRQIYSQDDERKSYDKMSGVKSQQSQQPAYHNGSHYGGGMGNNKKYNWNS